MKSIIILNEILCQTQFPASPYQRIYKHRRGGIIYYMDIEIIKNRKGAQKAADIPAEVLSLLNAGRIETVNLTEWLAVDHSLLVKSVFPALGIDKNVIEELVCQIHQQKKPSTMNTIRLIGAFLAEKYANTDLYKPLFEQLSTHLSDSVRCYACLVTDSHFGVREII